MSLIIPSDGRLVKLEATAGPLMAKYMEITTPQLEKLTMGTHQNRWIWTEVVPDMASTHRFLYHGMMAVASLPDRTLALEHHNIGLSMFIDVLATCKVDALFAHQCLMLIFSYGYLEKDLVGLKGVLTIIRGSSTIIDQRGVPEGPMSRLLELQPDGPSEDVKMLTGRLRGSISALTYHDLYAYTIGLLEYALGVAPDQMYGQVVANNIWILLPQEYLNLVWMGEPFALAILAGFGVALHRACKDDYFVGGWGKSIVDAVRPVLDQEWDDVMQWATKEVGG